MALIQEHFEQILLTLIDCKIDRAKFRLLQLVPNIIFESPPSIVANVEKLMGLLTLAYGEIPIPPIFREALFMNFGTPEIARHDLWSTQESYGIELIPFNILAIARQLNHDFDSDFRFSLAPAEPDRELKITYKLKHTAAVSSTGFFSDLQLPRHQEDCRLDWVKDVAFTMPYHSNPSL